MGSWVAETGTLGMLGTLRTTTAVLSTSQRAAATIDGADRLWVSQRHPGRPLRDVHRRPRQQHLGDQDASRTQSALLGRDQGAPGVEHPQLLVEGGPGRQPDQPGVRLQVGGQRQHTPLGATGGSRGCVQTDLHPGRTGLPCPRAGPRPARLASRLRRRRRSGAGRPPQHLQPAQAIALQLQPTFVGREHHGRRLDLRMRAGGHHA